MARDDTYTEEIGPVESNDEKHTDKVSVMSSKDEQVQPKAYRSAVFRYGPSDDVEKRHGSYQFTKKKNGKS